MVVGPYLELDLPGGGKTPLYLLRYAADGTPLSPETEALLRERAATATDVFVFAHGWNNVFQAAVDRYLHFARGYLTTGRVSDAPVLVGVIWPSTGFILPWERGPEIAAEDPATDEDLLRFVTDSLDGPAAGALAELVDGATGLPPAEAARAADLVRAALAAPDPDGRTAAPTVAGILAAWRTIESLGVPAGGEDPDEFGAFDGGPGPAEPHAAGLGALDPRNLLRMATVWKMKDRSGTVGAVGVGPLLRYLRERTPARLHLIGHSFGARLLLSAVAAAPADRKVHSLLLLQAAVNRWCFAPTVEGTGQPGGYRAVVGQLDQPVLATWSARDRPLHDLFPLIMAGSLGEPDIAALGDSYLYGALGGHGPNGLGPAGVSVPAAAPGTGYPDLAGGCEVLALDATAVISGHGDISNPATWWALHCLTGTG